MMTALPQAFAADINLIFRPLFLPIVHGKLGAIPAGLFRYIQARTRAIYDPTQTALKRPLQELSHLPEK
jgi:hypothetical protein